MTTSFDKSKLKILLLEGIHPSAERIFRDAGYQNIETVKTALTGEELKSRLDGVHFLGIRSRTTLTRDIFEAAEKLVASRLLLHRDQPSGSDCSHRAWRCRLQCTLLQYAICGRASAR